MNVPGVSEAVWPPAPRTVSASPLDSPHAQASASAREKKLTPCRERSEPRQGEGGATPSQ